MFWRIVILGLIFILGILLGVLQLYSDEWEGRGNHKK